MRGGSTASPSKSLRARLSTEVGTGGGELSREVGLEPREIQACLERVFNTQDQQVLSQTIKDALKLCPELKLK